MDAEIRLAQFTEVDAVVGFGYAVVPTYFVSLLGEDVASWRLAEWTRQHMQSAIGRAEVHVAVVDDDVVGVAETGMLAGEQVIWKLYVAPELRSRGLGTELLRRAIDSLPEHADHVLVGHFAGNTGAETFFDRAGFTVIGSDAPMFGGPESAMVWRRLDLG